jgi:O-antigen/teichoic acid export membrane protein
LSKTLYKSIGANWLGLFATMAVGFFLTPFILHRLGDTAFGLWVLMTTFTGYYGLFDFGIRNAIIRYVARFVANRDRVELSRVTTTSFVAYMGLCLAMLVLTVIGAWQLERIVSVSPQWLPTAKLILLVTGIGTALGFPLGMFGGILEGLQRFTWVSGVQVVASLVRAVLTVWALEKGHGILAIACITTVVNLISSGLYVAVAFRVCPNLEMKWQHAQKATLRMLFGFGVVTFWVGIGTVLRFQTDAWVIGAFISLPAVSMFSISSKLAAYASGVVQVMAQVFTPLSSHFDATGDVSQLRRILVVGNRYSSLVILPITTIFVVLGKTIIRVWVGPHYLPAYPVLVILTLPLTAGLMQAASTKVLYGMARHTLLARVLVVEGLSNLVLSIVLLRWYGIIGVAIGTAIPMVFTNVVFLPRHLCRLLGLRMRNFLQEAYVYPISITIPLGLILWVADQWIRPATYAGLLLELVIGAIPYGLGLLIYFYRKEKPEQLGSSAWAQALDRS